LIDAIISYFILCGLVFLMAPSIGHKVFSIVSFITFCILWYFSAIRKNWNTPKDNIIPGGSSSTGKTINSTL